MDETVRMGDQRGPVTGLGLSRLWLLWIAALLAPMLLSAPDAAAANHPAAIPDVTVLFGRALQAVHNTKRPTYSRAIVLEADGITKGGRCTTEGCLGGQGVLTAAGVVSWRFVFDNYSSRSRFKSATIYYGPAPKGFGGVTGYVDPFFGDDRIPNAPKMTLSQAVSLMRRAGYRRAFFNVTLRSPTGPKRSNPLYIFGFPNRAYPSVDTVTKQVRQFSKP